MEMELAIIPANIPIPRKSTINSDRKLSNGITVIILS